jgi:hypothetical protein
MITKAQLIAFWTGDDDDDAETATKKIVWRIKNEAFEEDVNTEAAKNMISWAQADPGHEAFRFAALAKAALGILPISDEPGSHKL